MAASPVPAPCAVPDVLKKATTSGGRWWGPGAPWDPGAATPQKHSRPQFPIGQNSRSEETQSRARCSTLRGRVPLPPAGPSPQLTNRRRRRRPRHAPRRQERCWALGRLAFVRRGWRLIGAGHAGAGGDDQQGRDGREEANETMLALIPGRWIEQIDAVASVGQGGELDQGRGQGRVWIVGIHATYDAGTVRNRPAPWRRSRAAH